MDKWADIEYHRATSSEDFVSTKFPFEKLMVKSGGEKLTGNLRRALDNLQGERTARTYLDSKDIVKSDDVPVVWWDGMENLMKGYPKMYRVWITKHVSGCCGTNKMMSY